MITRLLMQIKICMLCIFEVWLCCCRSHLSPAGIPRRSRAWWSDELFTGFYGNWGNIWFAALLFHRECSFCPAGNWEKTPLSFYSLFSLLNFFLGCWTLRPRNIDHKQAGVPAFDLFWSKVSINLNTVKHQLEFSGNKLLIMEKSKEKTLIKWH